MDRLLAFNDRPILDGAGAISHAAMKDIVHERYDQFDGHRRRADAVAADAQDLQMLDAAEKALMASRKT